MVDLRTRIRIPICTALLFSKKKICCTQVDNFIFDILNVEYFGWDTQLYRYTYIYMCVCIYKYIYVHVYIYIYICICVYTYTYIYMYIYIYVVVDVY